MNPFGRHRRVAILYIVMLTIVFSAIVGIGELAFRFLPPRPSPSGGLTYVQKNGYVSYPANFIQYFKNEIGVEIEVSSDRYGLRNPEGADSDAELLLLGDSFIAAVNTAESATLVGRLRANGVKTFNAGLDGSGTFEQVALYRDLPKFPKVRHVFLAVYLGNDIRDNWVSWSSAGRSPSPPQDTDRPIFLVRAYHAAKGLTGRLCNYSALCSQSTLLADRWLVKGNLGEEMASYPLGEIKSLVVTDPDARDARGAMERAIEELKRLVELRDQKLTVVGIPSKAQTLRSFREISGIDRDERSRQLLQQAITGGYNWDLNDHELARSMKNIGVQYISLLYIFREESVKTPVFYDLDAHWNNAGQRLAADRILQSLELLKRQSTTEAAK